MNQTKETIKELLTGLLFGVILFVVTYGIFYLISERQVYKQQQKIEMIKLQNELDSLINVRDSLKIHNQILKEVQGNESN